MVIVLVPLVLRVYDVHPVALCSLSFVTLIVCIRNDSNDVSKHIFRFFHAKAFHSSFRPLSRCTCTVQHSAGRPDPARIAYRGSDFPAPALREDLCCLVHPYAYLSALYTLCYRMYLPVHGSDIYHVQSVALDLTAHFSPGARWPFTPH